MDVVQVGALSLANLSLVIFLFYFLTKNVFWSNLLVHDVHRLLVQANKPYRHLYLFAKKRLEPVWLIGSDI